MLNSVNGRIKFVNNILINIIDSMNKHVIRILDTLIDGYQMRNMVQNVKSVIHY